MEPREPLSFDGVRDDLAPEEERQFIVETDLLIALLVEHWKQRRDWLDNQHPGFLEWLAREYEADEDDPELWSREEAAEVARVIESRLRAARAPVALVPGAAPTRRPAAAGTVSDVIDEAARLGCAPSLALAPAAGSGRALWDEECEEWVELPAGLPRGRYLALGVAGDSMEPLLHAGDVTLVRLGPAAQPGAVVVAQLPDDGYVTKQLGRMTRAAVEVCSINAAYSPICIPRTPDVILGTVVMRWCGHGGTADSPR